MSGDEGVMEGDIGTFQADIQSVLDALRTLRTDKQTYETASAAKGHTSTAIPPDAQISAGVSRALAAATKERGGFASARKKARQLIAEAKGAVATANAVCKRTGG